MVRTKFTQPHKERFRARVNEGSRVAMLANIANYVEKTDAARDIVVKRLEKIMDTMEKMDDKIKVLEEEVHEMRDGKLIGRGKEQRVRDSENEFVHVGIHVRCRSVFQGVDVDVPKGTRTEVVEKLRQVAKRFFADQECESKAWKITKPRAFKGKDVVVPGEAVAMGLVSAADYEALQGWLASTDGENRSTACGKDLSKEFFTTLQTPRYWIHSEHFEQSCFLLRKQSAERGYDIGRRVIVLDSYFSIYLEREWKEYNSDVGGYEASGILLSYFDGRAPAPMARPWAGVDLVLLPLNLRGRHWFAVALDLNEWQLKLYDCDVHCVIDVELPPLLMHVTHLLPIIMDAHAELKVKYASKLPGQFRIIRDKRVPQNKLSGDCGPYTIKFMELLMETDPTFDGLDDTFIGPYKQMLAAAIFNGQLGGSII